MYNANNQLLDRTEEPIVYPHGDYDDILPLVEEVLHDKDIGDTVEVTLSPDDAFDEQDLELMRIEDVDVFPAEVEVGMILEADSPEAGDVLIYRVADITDGKAMMDSNHPLTGMKVLFKVTVEDVRDAAEEEVAHGYIYGPYSHHHH